jgi:hypothetical protein
LEQGVLRGAGAQPEVTSARNRSERVTLRVSMRPAEASRGPDLAVLGRRLDAMDGGKVRAPLAGAECDTLPQMGHWIA